jgi:hypothetical protein
VFPAQPTTFLSDGGETVRQAQGEFRRFREPILDWFHVAMRRTQLSQAIKGLPADPSDEDDQACTRESPDPASGNNRCYRAGRFMFSGRYSYKAKQQEEMQAVADALSLLANLVMAWNTIKMQSVLDRWNARRFTLCRRGGSGASPDAHGGHQLAGSVQLPHRALRGRAITVTSGSKITRLSAAK